MRILGVIVLLLAGCLVGEDGLGSGSSNGRNITPVPTNGLVLDVELAAQFPTGPLGVRSADSITLASDTVAQFASPAGHALLKYLAICALPETDALTAGTRRFAGYYGFAPEWERSSCGETCQHWISACLLAHANADGMPFPISLRGEHAALDPSPKVVAEFTYQEAAYYGNIFHRQLYACVGADAQHASANDAARFLNGRICGPFSGGNCGIAATGFCASPQPQAEIDLGACGHRASPGGGFADCHTGAFAEYPRTSPIVHEVVTVYLQP